MQSLHQFIQHHLSIYQLEWQVLAFLPSKLLQTAATLQCAFKAIPDWTWSFSPRP